uniref:Uncharacterized protein n=1 Tax=Euplotes crassus TaxID=5936 RepID=A0A7S3K786_EUPCR|mmetsp:Transcript_10295/g.10151  ORF Transcript_10295/g.10151 Transcript_10295/m.10151 type:complete len:357 (+) Transcript_10295:18-1088(+)
MSSKAKELLAKKKKKANQKKKTTKKEELSAKNKQDTSSAKQENEWEVEKETPQAKTTFKIEGKEVDELQKKIVKEDKKEEVAKWDEEGQEFLKADENSAKLVQDASAAKPSVPGKSASDIQFGGKPSFGSGRPKFTSTGNKSNGAGLGKKSMGAEYFPELGDTAPPPEKDTSSRKLNGPPKFTGNNKNRFDQLEVHKTNKEDKKDDQKDDNREQAPRFKKRKDEFFGNFRTNNKNIKADESSPKETEPKPTTSSGGPPKFFSKGASNKMTMAKAQEEAERKKEELKKKEDAEEAKMDKKKPLAKKKFNDDKKDNKFIKREPKKVAEDKPREKKPKVSKEKAVLEDEWGAGGLEDVL